MKKILLVEDDTVLNKTLAYNLTADGYEVTSAYTFASAVNYLQKAEYHLALLDINLPDGCGLDLCDEIRKKVTAVFANMELRHPQHDLYNDGVLKIDFSEQSASLAGEPLDFTPKEYRTLFLFVKNPRIILTKRQLLEKLWDIDGDFVDEHTLATIISRIRKKIETDERKYIKTAYGMGYQWMGGERK